MQVVRRTLVEGRPTGRIHEGWTCFLLHQQISLDASPASSFFSAPLLKLKCFCAVRCQKHKMLSIWPLQEHCRPRACGQITSISDYSHTLWSDSSRNGNPVCASEGSGPVELLQEDTQQSRINGSRHTDQRETHQNTERGSATSVFFFAINWASLLTWSSTFPSPSHLIPFQSSPSCSVVTIPQKDMLRLVLCLYLAWPTGYTG